MTERCYLCGAAKFVRRKGQVRDAPTLAVLECRECGLVALDSHDHIRPDHYENSRMHGAAPGSIESLLRQCDADDRRRFEMLAPVITDRRLLDFGCGAGGFLCHARTLASEVAGV